jgi:hypothetical protein
MAAADVRDQPSVHNEGWVSVHSAGASVEEVASAVEDTPETRNFLK